MINGQSFVLRRARRGEGLFNSECWLKIPITKLEYRGTDDAKST